MLAWSLGTIGFTYPEWRGSFYPSGLPSNQSLPYYSKIFNAVEINTTFYGPKPPQEIEKWVAATPDDFCFCMKTPRHITHELRLQAPAVEEMRVFVDDSLALGDKLGAFLVQFPPSFHADQLPQLAQFFTALFSDERYRAPDYAVELRHPSWYTREIAPRLSALLQQHGVCWVTSDYETMPPAIHPTTHFLYMRFIAKHGVLEHPGHEVLDRTERLEDWLKLVDEVLEKAPRKIDHIFGFFDNDYAGHAPATCNKFKALLGLPVSPSQPGEQGRLF